MFGQSADERRAYAAFAEAAQTIGREHDEECRCLQCQFALEVFIHCLNKANL